MLGGGEKAGYRYRYISHPKADRTIDSYEVFADPIRAGKTSKRNFLLNQTGAIRMSDNEPAGATSSALQ